MTERLDRIEANLELLGDRVGQLAQNVSDLRHSTSDLTVSVSELCQELRASNEARRIDIEVMVGLFDTLSANIRNSNEAQLTERIAWQAEIQRIWKYLQRQNPNGHGE